MHDERKQKHLANPSCPVIIADLYCILPAFVRNRFIRPIVYALQDNYSYKKPTLDIGNEIVPCPIRDHHSEFNKIASESDALPVGETAKRSMKDEKFINDLTKIGKKAAEATEDLWRNEYHKIKDTSKVEIS